MENRSDFDAFIARIRNWGIKTEEIRAINLVGSYARGSQNSSSDVDLIILTTDRNYLITNPEIYDDFGKRTDMGIEYYGAVTSVRVYYQDSFEVEYGITDMNWIALPLDSGTRQVLSDGYKVILDKENYFDSIK